MANIDNIQITWKTKARFFLWPIFGKEHKKFLPLTLMISLILFDYTIFRNIKDTIVIHATGGAEILTFLKVWVVLPLAFLFFLIFTKLTNIFFRRQIFYGTIIFFLGFFLLFAYVLYPNQQVLHPIKSAAWLSDNLPGQFKSFIDIYRFWSFSLFYAMAELWGSIVAALLFWQFANHIIHVAEAKRFYAHFYLLANLATAAAGLVSQYFSNKGIGIYNQIVRYGYSLNYLVLIATIAGIGVMLLYYYMDKYVLPDPELVAEKDNNNYHTAKLKLSLVDSIKFIFRSKYLGLIAILLISYGITINLIEVAWKHQVHIAFSNINDYNAYMGMVAFYSGLVTFVIILIGSYLIRLLGWRAGALATPVILGITGSVFFYFMLFDNSVSTLAAALGTTSILLTAAIGTVQNILSKSTKYALFDPTKEMAYIPLDDESKTKGKAAVDVVAARLGKAGGALIQQAMFIFIGPMAVIAPYAAIIMLVVILGWVFAVFKLYRLFNVSIED